MARLHQGTWRAKSTPFFSTLSPRTPQLRSLTGMSNAANPAFDASGKYLYFTASTNSGPSAAGIDLSSLDRATNSGVYVAVLARTTASPVPPESDDEGKKKDDAAPKNDKTEKSDKPRQGQKNQKRR